MLRFCLRYLGGTQGRLLWALSCALPWVSLRLLASFTSLPPIVQSKYSFCTLSFLSDLLTGACEVDCGLVAMVTSLMLFLPASQHPPYPLRIDRKKNFFWSSKTSFFTTFRPNDDRVSSWKWNNFTNNNSWRVLTAHMECEVFLPIRFFAASTLQSSTEGRIFFDTLCFSSVNNLIDNATCFSCVNHSWSKGLPRYPLDYRLSSC